MFTKEIRFQMRVTIKNLGVVKEADISLNGLTILTGNNDTGKSFIGKIIFSIIHTLKNAKNHYDESRIIELESMFFYILQEHRNVIQFTKQRIERFNPEGLIMALGESLDDNEIGKESRNQLKKYKEEVLADLKITPKPNSRITANELEKAKTQIEFYFDRINAIINAEPNYQEIYKFYFNSRIIKNYFGSQINSFRGGKLEIKFIEGESVLLEIEIENNLVNFFKYDEANPILQSDASIIDTPAILTLDHPNYYMESRRTRTYLEHPLPLHYRDLLKKINTPTTYDNENRNIFTEISRLIDGSVKYDKDNHSFNFTKNNHIIKPTNIATGIKSFILLQRLIISGNINNHSFLIVDEPEVHLHPKWEIEYAKIIVELSKAGIPILISSHSPYFLQAVVKYINELQIKNKTNFYFGSNKNGSSTFENVTDDLEPIFKALAEPMRTLSF